MKTVNLNRDTFFVMIASLVLWAAVLACSSSPTSTPGSKYVPLPASQTPQRASADCLEGVFPGVTTRDQLVAVLGEPASTEMNDAQEILLYATGNSGLFHAIVLQDNVVGLVSVILDESSPLAWSSVIQHYGNPSLTTYSDFLEGTRTYIYPERGQSFVAEPDLDVVYARECFTPMAAEGFMASWGNSLPQDDPFSR